MNLNSNYSKLFNLLMSNLKEARDVGLSLGAFIAQVLSPFDTKWQILIVRRTLTRSIGLKFILGHGCFRP